VLTLWAGHGAEGPSGFGPVWAVPIQHVRGQHALRDQGRKGTPTIFEMQSSVEIRVKNIFRKLHTLSAKQRLTAGPAKLHSQIFYLYGSRIY
jgi:hypothetical protein